MTPFGTVLYNCTLAPADDAIIHYFNSFHTDKVEIPVKSELPVTVKACTFEEQIKGVALSIFSCFAAITLLTFLIDSIKL